MRRPAADALAALALSPLAACDFYPEGVPGIAADDSAGAAADCSADIFVPTGSLQGQPVPATPHADTYGAAPAPYHVHLGWPSSDLSRSTAMLWRTDTGTLASVVEWGPADTWPAGATRTEGASFLYGGGTIGEGPFRIHEVRLCGLLSPGTAYTYRVGGDGGWSDPITFTAPRAPGDTAPLRVVLAGDSRGAYDTWRTLLQAADAVEPYLILFSGDMVELGANQLEWDAWFEASGDILARRPFIAAHGNHEFLAQAYFAQFAFPGNEEWFDVQTAGLHVLSLNDTVRDAADIDTTQARFIDDTLGARTAPWAFAMHHQPAYSTCTRHGSDIVVRDAWAPLFDKHGVDVVLAGHNHIYERSVPIAAGQEDPTGRGTVYIVSGGAGAPLYRESETDWFNAKAEPIEHWITADIGADTAEVVVRDLAGNVIDSFSVLR